MGPYHFLQTLEVLPSPEEKRALERATEWMVAALNVALVPLRRHAEIVVGGSYAKGTLVKSKAYDIDIFIRYPGEQELLLQVLVPALRELCAHHCLSFERVHGSREYFRVQYAQNIVFEIVPVRTIRAPREAENVTDLSYLHVAYVRKAVRKKRALTREIGLAKQFCKAQCVYGAESYVQGFSGYALECLVIAYGSFLKMLRGLAEADEQVILDPARHYRAKREVLRALNESKLQSPIVLIDPTWKERNVLAALNRETFTRFQRAARAFLRKPGPSFFEQAPVTHETLALRARKQGAESVCVVVETLKQAGDIAGTKMKKFSDVLARYFPPHFVVADREFVYSGAHQATAYYFVKPAKPVLMRGPPLAMKEHARRFKKEHPHAIIKRGIMYAALKKPESGRAYIQEVLKKYEPMVRQMDISSVRVV